MDAKYFFGGILLGTALAFSATNSNVTINRIATNKDGVSAIQAASQTGMEACNQHLFYFTDKSLQATILTAFFQGKTIRKMQWTNTGTNVNIGGDDTSCRLDYVDFDP